MPRGNTQLIEVLRGFALTNSGTVRVSRELPVGEPWDELILQFNHTVTIGTGTGFLAEGVLRIIRGLTLRSDKGDVFVENVPGRAMYRWAATKNGRPGLLTPALADATDVYRATIRIPFWDRLALRPLDTILDTSRYQSLTLELAYGAIADLYGTVGTATVTGTVDIYVRRRKGVLDAEVKPVFAKYFGVTPPADPASVTEITLERAANLTYQRLMLFTTESATAGLPFSGTADLDAVSQWQLDSGLPEFQNVLMQQTADNFLPGVNADDYGWETPISGLAILDLVRDGSLQSGLYSGDKSRLRVQWTNDVAGAGTRQVSCAFEGLRPLLP